MPKVERAGRYQGFVTNKAIVQSHSGGLQFEADCELHEIWNATAKKYEPLPAVQHIKAFISILTKDRKRVPAHVNNLKECYGWDGNSVRSMQAIDTKAVKVSFDIRTNDNANKEKYPFQVAFINPVYASSTKAPDASTLDALDALWKESGIGTEQSQSALPEAF